MARRPVCRPRFARSCDERSFMVTLLFLLLILLAARGVLWLVRVWRAVPHRNADFEVFR